MIRYDPDIGGGDDPIATVFLIKIYNRNLAIIYAHSGVNTLFKFLTLRLCVRVALRREPFCFRNCGDGELRA